MHSPKDPNGGKLCLPTMNGFREPLRRHRWTRVRKPEVSPSIRA
jgi:hypothetical protein